MSVSNSPYAIVPSAAAGTGLSNYTIGYVSGKLVVTPASLTITANNQSRVYGQPNPPLTVYYQGFVNGDTPASLTAPVALSTPAVPASFAGSYPIFVGGAASPNYAIRFVSGTLAIMPPTNPVVLGNIAFVTSLYRDLLLTSPGPADLFSWLQQLAAPRSALQRRVRHQPIARTPCRAAFAPWGRNQLCCRTPARGEGPAACHPERAASP